MRHFSSIIMNPPTPTAHYRLADSLQADLPIVVSANRQDRRHFAKCANQITQLA